MNESLVNKIAGLTAVKRLQRKCFPVNIRKFLRTFFYRTSPVAASGYRVQEGLWEVGCLKNKKSLKT